MLINRIFLFLLFLLASLYVSTSFASPPPDPTGCNQYVTNSSGAFDILLIKNMSVADIIKCGSPAGAKSSSLSPIAIFQLITNYIAYMAFALSIIAVIVSVIQIATSAGDKTKYQSATDLLKNAVLAFIISISVYSILNISLSIIGFNVPKDTTAITIINECTAGSLTDSKCTTALKSYTYCKNTVPTYLGYCKTLFCSRAPKDTDCPTGQ